VPDGTDIAYNLRAGQWHIAAKLHSIAEEKHRRPALPADDGAASSDGRSHLQAMMGEHEYACMYQAVRVGVRHGLWYRGFLDSNTASWQPQACVCHCGL
jgi:hypothetical protein